MISVILIVAFFVISVAALLTARHVTKQQPDKPEIEKINGGWVIRRFREDNHFCDPPDSDGTKEDERSCWDFKDRWIVGDQWLCGCGRAWAVVPTYPGSSFKVWRRSSKDDVAVIDP
jgi:hypothetical protein